MTQDRREAGRGSRSSGKNADPNRKTSQPTGKARRGARPIAGLIGSILKPAVRKRGLAGANLVTAWPEIVGPAYADCTLPEKMTWPQDRFADDGGAGRAGTLTIRCDGPASVLLQHEATIVAERINTFLGWHAVERVKIVQGTVPPRDAEKPQAAARISAERKADIESRVVGIEDDRLRAALTRLGIHVVAQAASVADDKSGDAD